MKRIVLPSALCLVPYLATLPVDPSVIAAADTMITTSVEKIVKNSTACLPLYIYMATLQKNLFQCCFYFYLYEYSICVCYYYFGFCCGLLPAARWRTGFFNLNALFSGLLLLLLLQLIDDIFTHPQIVCVYRCLYILFFTKFICYIQVHTCMQLGG